jgi:integrase
LAKKRAHGEGTIYFWEKKNLWVAKLSLPDGKRKTKYGKTQREVRDWLITARKAMQDGIFVENDTITVSQFLNRYLDDYAVHSLRPSTIASYRHNIKNHIIPVIGHIKLSQLRADHLHALYNQKLEEGLSPKTVQNLHSIVHRTLNKAVKWGLVNYNISDKAEAPKYQKKEMKTWTGEQVKRFLSYMENDRWWTLYVLACGTGMREGEILALRWQNVNLDEGHLKVVQALQAVKGYGLIFVEPKSKKSRRMVVLPEFVVEALSIHKERQAGLRKSPKWTEHGLVFTTNVGTPINPRNLIRHFKKKIGEADLPEIRFHDLRHTTATLLLESNTHPKIVQELLGHSSIILTLDQYSHVIPTLQQEAAKSLDRLLK